MDDDKDKGRKSPGRKAGARGKPGAGRPERPARWPGPRRDGPPPASDSRRENPRRFKDFKTKPSGRSGEAGDGRKPGRPARGPGPRDGEPRRSDSRGMNPRRFGEFKGPRPDDAGERVPGKGPRPGRREREQSREAGGNERVAGEGPPRRFESRPRFADERRGRKPPRGGEEQAQGEGERIAKRLARAGIASRRDAEALIAAGRVRVNGRVLSSPAHNVFASDTIEVDGADIPPVERTRLFLFHKPAGVVTTNRDPEGRKTVFDVLPADLPRLITVGRLDINTEGLLLLTNDGGLARVLELPATGWLRRYRARVHGQVDEKALAGLKDGIAVDGVFYGAIEAALDREQGSNAWLTIGLREGKNREVKNVLGALGLGVTRLIRISFGPFQLGELPEGAVLELKGRTLRDQLGPRLIEEAGANFDAPVVRPFSNSPVRGKPDSDRDGQRPRGPRRPEPVGEGGLIKRRKAREEGRDRALSQLDTRPHRGKDAPSGPGKGRKDERGDLPRTGGPRKANVWMAPGARPKGGKGAAGTGPDPRGGKGGPRGPRKGGGADRRR